MSDPRLKAADRTNGGGCICGCHVLGMDHLHTQTRNGRDPRQSLGVDEPTRYEGASEQSALSGRRALLEDERRPHPHYADLRMHDLERIQSSFYVGLFARISSSARVTRTRQGNCRATLLADGGDHQARSVWLRTRHHGPSLTRVCRSNAGVLLQNSAPDQRPLPARLRMSWFA